MSIFKRRRRPLQSIDEVIEIVDDLIVRHEKAKAQADLSLRMVSKALDDMERTWQAKLNGNGSSPSPNPSSSKRKRISNG